MSAEQFVLEAIHWLGSLCLLASFVNRLLPTPEEVPGRRYLIFYNTVRRMSINAGWKPNAGRNGGTK